MHAYVLPTFLNGQTMRANMFANLCCFAAPNNRCFSGKRQRHPPPSPPGWLTQRGMEWEAPHKYFATQRCQHLWHLFVCHTAITCHKVAITLLSPSLALMLGSTTYPEHCSENISPKCTRKQRAVRGMHHLQKQPPHADCPPSRPPPSSPCSNPPRRGLASVGVGVLGAPDPAPEAVTNYYVTRPPPPGRQPSSKPCNAAP